ncbi:MAG: putative peroxiredoxin bcp [Alphaproteobacteria bacterium MarineAlpha3_Bin5]|nr:thioredoxin-dependent thiol peroxidase [Magnetovibrio sp.]PPR79661.1 MAG: putative peroxiredoxin bcp [Alphaproteobacteria bacterium MarineAlpha3_Bin5]|tara:strand:- start:45 stop:509 length:465 start_codon:yes stop_codon:yes gene_type:complete
MSISVGAKAPDFILPTDSNKKLSLSDLKGRKVVLYFYPKDLTPGCTVEAQDFRDHADKFKKAGAVIIGVSKDSIERHEKFKLKHHLNFVLLSDKDGTLCEDYGVWQKKKLYGREFMGIVRTTFVIDGGGVVRNVWEKVKVKGHVVEVLESLTRI